MVIMSEKEIEWTSISVSKPVLRWVSSIKSLLEYKHRKKMINNEALVWICGIADHKLATELGLTEKDFTTFMLERIEEVLSADGEREIQAMLDDAKSFGLFKK